MVTARTREPGSTAGPSIRLRALRRDDFDRVLELEHTLFGLGAWSYGMLAEELAGWGRWYIVAEEVVPQPVGRAGAGRGLGTAFGQIPGSHVVGYAGLWFDGDVTQVMTIGVDPTRQRQGVGRALIEALIARSRELKASAVLLEVRVDNDAALALYADLGFERLGVRKRYYQPEGKDAYTMRLDLTAPRPSDDDGEADLAASGPSDDDVEPGRLASRRGDDIPVDVAGAPIADANALAGATAADKDAS